MPNQVLAFAPAKLNISFRIGKIEKATGMHYVTSVMQAISLCDYLTIRKADSFSIEGNLFPNDIISRAVEELSKEAGRGIGCQIVCHKVIPEAAGLGGGSSDAATVLKTLNEMYRLKFSMKRLQIIASRVGNDVPFLLYGGRARIKGASTHTIERMRTPKLFYLVAHPMARLSTKEMYAEHDKTGKSFVQLAVERCPETGILLDAMGKSNPTEYGITGKGPTVFAAFADYGKCLAAMAQIPKLENTEFFAAHALDPGKPPSLRIR